MRNKFFDDILGEKVSGYTKYSQGRVYLFISFIAFFIINVVLAVCAITNIPLDNTDLLIIVSSNLKWVLASLLLYVLGGKGVGAFRDSQTGISNSYREPNNFEHNSYWGNHNYGPGFGGGGGGYGGRYGYRPKNEDQLRDDVDESSGSVGGETFYPIGDEEVE
jgi:hypothetical protein